MRSDTLTASRMGALLACPRKHYWRYEVGLHPAVSAAARGGPAGTKAGARVAAQLRRDDVPVLRVRDVLHAEHPG